MEVDRGRRWRKGGEGILRGRRGRGGRGGQKGERGEEEEWRVEREKRLTTTRDRCGLGEGDVVHGMGEIWDWRG